MTAQPPLAEGFSDIGAGLFLGAVVLAIVWFHIGRMRWRPPAEELRKLDLLRQDGLIDDKEYQSKRKKLLNRF